MKLSALTALVGLAGIAALAACSGADPKAGSESASDPAPDAVFDITKDETWATGKRIGGQVNIAAGVTVTLAPGAAVSAAHGTFLTVKGTLKVASVAQHAKLRGEAWGGIVVAEGGRLEAAGLDIENATAALDMQGGTATFDDGVIAWAATPFRVVEGASLSMARTNVVSARGHSRVKGTFTASHVDYETLANEGIIVDAAGATVTIEDSKLHGKGDPTDVIMAYAGSLKIAYSDISNAHCGLHLWNVNALDVSHVTIHDTAYGAMLYGSQPDATMLSITSSNIENNTVLGVEEQDDSANGALAIRRCYFGGNAADSRLQASSKISIASSVTTRLSDAQPR